MPAPVVYAIGVALTPVVVRAAPHLHRLLPYYERMRTSVSTTWYSVSPQLAQILKVKPVEWEGRLFATGRQLLNLGKKGAPHEVFNTTLPGGSYSEFYLKTMKDANWKAKVPSSAQIQQEASRLWQYLQQEGQFTSFAQKVWKAVVEGRGSPPVP